MTDSSTSRALAILRCLAACSVLGIVALSSAAIAQAKLTPTRLPDPVAIEGCADGSVDPPARKMKPVAEHPEKRTMTEEGYRAALDRAAEANVDHLTELAGDYPLSPAVQLAIVREARLFTSGYVLIEAAQRVIELHEGGCVVSTDDLAVAYRTLVDALITAESYADALAWACRYVAAQPDRHDGDTLVASVFCAYGDAETCLDFLDKLFARPELPPPADTNVCHPFPAAPMLQSIGWDHRFAILKEHPRYEALKDAHGCN